MGQGFVKLNRQIQDCWIWEDKPYAMGQAWVDLIMLANHEDRKEFRDGKLQVFKRGTVNRSIQFLSDRWGWDRKKTRRFLDVLASDNMVVVDSTTHGTTITLVNYEVFNSPRTTDGTTATTTDGQRLPQPLPINKNVKNDKECKEVKENNTKKFVPPSLDEVKEYIREKKLSVDGEQFYNYFTAGNWIDAKGQNVKSWKQKLLTWDKFGSGRSRDTKNDCVRGTLVTEIDELERLTMAKIGGYE